MKHKNRYTRQSQSILVLFEDASHPRKVLCFILDYAKLTHTAPWLHGTQQLNPAPAHRELIGAIYEIDLHCRRKNNRAVWIVETIPIGRIVLRG
jgi:hypothetical protein